MAIGMVARQFHRLFGEGTVSGMDEGELLRRFAQSRDPAALEALVNRHGPMVLGVCRRVTGDPHEAEDAFQATFLILARKAGAIRDPGRLGAWLFGVAHRVATRSRANSAKRRSRERPGAEEAAMVAGSSESEGFDRDELRRALDDEVRRLPEKFRDPVVLCYLDGLTHDEAALRLSCPVGTVRSRLSTARAKLRDRLVRRGVGVPSGAFAAALAAETARAAVPSVLVDSTLRAAIAFAAGGAGASVIAGASSAAASSLAKDVSRAMLMTKIKILGGLAMAGALTVGVGGAVAQIGGGAGQEKADESLDATIAKLKKQAEEAEEGRKQLKRDLSDARRENVDLKEKLRALAEAAGVTGPPPPAMLPASPSAQPPAPGIPPLAGPNELAPIVVAPPAPVTAPFAPGSGIPAGAVNQVGGPPNGPGVFGYTGGNKIGVVPPGAAGADQPMTLSTTNEAGGDPFRPVVPAHAMGMAGGAGRMMGAGGMAGMMRGGRAQPSSLAAIETIDCIIVHKPQSDQVSAYSYETGEWTSYAVPAGTEAQPLGYPGVVALLMKGDDVRRVAAYVPGVGRWFPFDLKAPAKGQVIPIYARGAIAYPVGDRVYAFSPTTRTWDVLELPEASGRVITGSKIENGGHIYMFNAKTGKWSDFDTTTGKVAGAKGE